MKTDFSHPTILLVSEQPRSTATGTVQICQFDLPTWMRRTADDGERNVSKAAQAKAKDLFRCRTGKEVRLSTGTLQPLEDPHSSRHPWNPGPSKVGLQGAPWKPVILAAGERKPHRSAPPPVAEAATAAQLLPWKQSSLPLQVFFEYPAYAWK